MVQPQLVKIGGPWTRSMIRGSMDPVHERGSMDPVHILMDPVHGPGPQRGCMDQGSMVCTFPRRHPKEGNPFGSPWDTPGLERPYLFSSSLLQHFDYIKHSHLVPGRHAVLIYGGMYTILKANRKLNNI